MTLKEIIDNLKSIALTQPDVRAASDGDVYEKMNGNPSIKYSVFHATQTTHQTEDGWDNYGLSLFLIDRLVDDSSNRLEIQSRAKETLNNIILTFCENFDAEHTSITFTPFTQKFKDDCAGVWCNVTIGVQADYNCAIDYAGGSYYPSITVIDNKDITITENGVYEVPEGYTGYGKITVNLEMQDTKDFTVTDNGHYTIIPDGDYSSMKKVELDVDVYIPSIKENDTITLKAGDSGVYKPEGYAAVAEVNYEVLPNQDKDVTITSNGTYTFTYDEEYSGLGQINTNVELPIQNTKETTIKRNGTYTITPDDNNVGIEEVTINVEIPIQSTKGMAFNDVGLYTIRPDDGNVALEEVTVNFDYRPKMVIPNGISFAGSTWETFPMENYDWSKVTDGMQLFACCPNLDYTPILEYIKDGRLPVQTPREMFAYNNTTELIEGIDFCQFIAPERMFVSQGNLKEVRNCKLAQPKNYYYSNIRLITPISSGPKFKVVNCDWSDVKEKYFGLENYYFAGVIDEFHPEMTGLDSNIVYAVNCPKPENMTFDSTVQVWFNPENGDGWVESSNVHPWGYWFEVINKNHPPIDEFKLLPSDSRIYDEMILPLVDGKYYADYPLFSNPKVYINGNNVEELNNRFNMSFYYPPHEVGVFEGKDIENLIWITLDSSLEITDEGIVPTTTGSLPKQKLYSAGNTVKVTVENNGAYSYMYINSQFLSVKKGTNEYVVELSGENIFTIQIYQSQLGATKITKIEIL